MSALTPRGQEFLDMLQRAPLETRRMMLFVIVAIKHEAWPQAAFEASKPSETDDEAIELFHGLIRSIPEARRAEVWREVAELCPVEAMNA